jgi:hypothetical protein
MAGAALVTTAVISWLFVLPQQIRGHAENPYAGIVVFLVLPAVFFLGLALIPVGVYLGKRQVREGLGQAPFDRKAALTRLGWFLGITTAANVLIGTQITYRAITYMETPKFCGQSCHPMQPQFTAHDATHAELECVECHVAPGAAGWLASKTSGTRQLFETILGTYSRPIPGALESGRLVPATLTCENCHWAGKHGAFKLRVIPSYAEDEHNTRTQTVLLMFVGGSRLEGIHGKHFGPGIRVRYAAVDAKRQTIPWVEYRNASGQIETFVSEGTTPESAKSLAIHEMQCVDCHNRPTHAFQSASRGLNDAMAIGEISTGLPFVKKKGMELLNATYTSNAEAGEKLPAALVSFYRDSYPEVYRTRPEDVQQAAKAVLAVYNRNVFPDMKVTWGTYPNNLGHIDFPGCFRCHDGSHAAADGKSIVQDCDACHQMVATDEAAPEILKTLGLEERLSKLQKK